MTNNKCGVLIFLSALLVIFIFSVSTGNAGDDIYKWVDENGVTRFSNKPPDSDPSVQKYETTEMQVLPTRKQNINNSESKKNYFARVKNSIQKWFNDKTGKTCKSDKEDKKS